MNTTPYWSDTVRQPKFPRLSRNLSVDIAVIGGGITGATAAYLLQKAGASVALLERGQCGSAETGHTTAHLTYVTDSRLQDLVKRFGRDDAQATWDAGLAAVQRIADIVKDEAVACDFVWIPGFLHAPQGKRLEGETERLQADAELAREFGFDATFLRKVPFVERPGIAFANQAKFHPLKYVAGLLKAFRRLGGQIFENTEVKTIELDPPTIKTASRTVHCKDIVIATHVPLQGATGTVSAALFQTKLASYSTYAVGAKIKTGLVPEASFWDTSDPYFYLRINRGPDYDYAILGGADHKTGQTRDPEKHYARVEKRLKQLFAEARVEHRWSGQVVESNDGLPFIGETAPHQFVATAFAGNGMTFGTVAAMMISDVISGRKNPWRDLFRVDRKSLGSGAWNYLKENKDYPYYMAKQFLNKPAAHSLRGLARGTGKVALLDGARVAAYRDEKGKLSVKSAICPHMGCVVRWNQVEKSWDCPCHGSRFQATGEVMAGPAEAPLSDPPSKDGES